MTVRATDPLGASAVIVVTIVVTDVNEQPVFESDTATRSFPENPPPGHDIGAPVTATDADGDSLAYSLEGADAASFAIDVESGQLRTKAGVTYDHELKSSYSVTVRATDPLGASAVIVVTIVVTDVNEQPVFESDTATRSFPENTPPGHDIGAPVTATDADGDPLTYGLEGADAASFDIDPDTGQLRTKAGVTYDHELKSSYSVTVRATDPLGASAVIVVTIVVTDVNEQPVFESDTATRSFPENPPPGHDIGAPVTATDADGDSLAYGLEGADAASFAIDADSGQLRTKAGVTYDHELKSSYSVTVRATDPLGASAVIVVTIVVTDVNEQPATPGAPTVRPVEGSSTRLLVTWTAPDRNGGPPLTGYDVAYRQGVSGDWRVWPHDGTAPTTTVAGLRAHTDYQVRVRAFNDEAWSDWSPPGSGRTNNTTPAFDNAATTRSVAENTPPGENIGTPVTATDADGDPLFYTLAGVDAASFDIESESGQLKTKADVSYDYETKASYSVTVRAMDPLNASGAIAVIITVTDVDEQPATPGAPTVRPVEGSSTRLLVTWTAPDRNGGPPLTGYDVAYRQGVSGDWRVWPHDGTAPTTTVAGLRAHTDYQVRVRAFNDEAWSDWSPPGSGRTNNTTPAFDNAATTRSVAENTPPGENIGAPVTATDADGDSLAYGLEGADAAAFAIESESGQLRTKAGVTYDHELKSSYLVTVRATDPLGASAVIVVTIVVTDVDEQPATPEAPTVRAPDGSSTSLLVSWRAPDTNGGPPLTGYDAAYRQGVSGAWRVWPHSGTVTTTTITGLKAHTDYQVRVRVLNGELPSDWSPPGSGRTNNTAPAFASATDTRSFPENTPPGQDIGAPIAAADPDGDPLTYTLAGVDAASFDIESESGQLKTKADVSYDHEVKTSYSVTVRVTDPLDASATIAVVITVTNVNEKPATPDAPTVRPVEGSSMGLLVNWITPDRNGGPPLTGYDVEYRQGASSEWRAWPHSGTGTTTTITGLSTSTDYQVRVRALNGEAPSDWSPPGSGRTNATMNGWLARFGRTVAQQVLEGVEDRLRSPCREGLQGTIAGHGFGSAARADLRTLSRWDDGDLEADRLFDARLLAERDPLSGSRFELSGETSGGGVACVWGRGVRSGFDGREGTSALDGEVTTGTLGADYAKGPWTVGLALSHSRGEGSYGRAYGKDAVEASLTGFYPYAGYKVTERFSVWGLGGLGRGALRLTPQDGFSMETDMGLTMAAVGARSALVTAAHGLNVALQTDGFWARTASDAAAGLLAAQADATRLRLGLESFYTAVLKTGGTLTPRFEIAWRYDGGGAEAGLGVDVGVGLVWSAPVHGISAEIETRRVLMHESTGFRDWSVSGMVRYDPNPSSDRGLSASLRSSTGTASLGGVDALLARDTLSGLSLYDGSRAGQLTAEAAYGFPILGGRFTGAPWAGAGVLGSGRDYRVGYRVSRARQSGSGMQVGIEGVRRENDGDAEAEHAIGLRLTLGW